MPPLVGVAVKVTELPGQVGLEPELMAMDTKGVTFAVIFSAMALLVAVIVVTQLILVVIMQLMLPAIVPASV